MRGKLLYRRTPIQILRIIPARAGQTHPDASAVQRAADHPRACGANALQQSGMVANSGSSPRVRGKRDAKRVEIRFLRIIPARAGQTVVMVPVLALTPDHPRACGANEGADGSGELAYGSSPRVRGKRAQCGERLSGGGIIPARAGQTTARAYPASTRPDHPRACGANSVLSASDSAHSGSSPRVRGKPPRPSRLPYGGRIIPARAGQTHPDP